MFIFVVRHNCESVLVPPDGKRCFHIAVRTAWRDYKLCCAFDVLSISVSAHKSSTIADLDVVDMTGEG